MFETIIREAAERFGLGNQAGAFIKELISMMFNPASGGVSGFLQKFKDAGFDRQIASWVGGNPGDNELQPDQVNAALGGDVVSSLAGKLGVPASAVSMATAGLLPKVIAGLTPGGKIPTEIPAGLGSLLPGLGGLGAAAAALGSGASDAVGRGAGAATAAAGAAGDALGRGASAAAGMVGGAASGAAEAAAGGMGWLKWLLPLILVIGGLFLYRGCQKQEATAPEATPPAAEATPALEPAPASTAPSEPAAPAATETAPPADTAAAPAAEAPPAASPPDASAALSALQAGNFTADDLVKALNLTGIQFDTGSSRISAKSEDILKQAAEAIKKAPAGTKVEIGGHTDNTGNAGANMKLSDARANAVRKRLTELGVDAGTLSAKGYGDATPIADNATAEGRAKNRRMEFKVVP